MVSHSIKVDLLCFYHHYLHIRYCKYSSWSVINHQACVPKSFEVLKMSLFNDTRFQTQSADTPRAVWCQGLICLMQFHESHCRVRKRPKMMDGRRRGGRRDGSGGGGGLVNESLIESTERVCAHLSCQFLVCCYCVSAIRQFQEIRLYVLILLRQLLQVRFLISPSWNHSRVSEKWNFLGASLTVWRCFQYITGPFHLLALLWRRDKCFSPMWRFLKRSNTTWHHVPVALADRHRALVSCRGGGGGRGLIQPCLLLSNWNKFAN